MKPDDISGKTVLISPLDWGMGHTTRCIPIIRQLIQQNNQVIFAGTEIQNQLIAKDFPNLTLEKIDGYNIRLDGSKSTYLQLFQQWPKIRRVIQAEQKIAENLAKKHNIDVLISDNRYGFRSNGVKNIFMTHQLSPPLPTAKEFVGKKLRKYINKFDACWIPDEAHKQLARGLNDAPLKIPKHFIGWLSRFEEVDGPSERKYLIIISGPEPERSHFARKSMQKFANQGSCLFVLPEDMKETEVLKVIHPSTAQLGKLINTSEIIISRAGYTTIMELIKLQKKAILIPTKGQYEQEYLAKHIEYPRFQFIPETKFFN
ncbi:MAG: glycosyltransferase [Crocinitomicaceae bacterium]